MMISKGQCDASGKVFTFVGDMYDAMVQKNKTVKTVLRIINNEKFVFEMFGKDDTGKEFLSMKVTCSRV